MIHTVVVGDQALIAISGSLKKAAGSVNAPVFISRMEAMNSFSSHIRKTPFLKSSSGPYAVLPMKHLKTQIFPCRMSVAIIKKE